jgi:hypothetical protein
MIQWYINSRPVPRAVARNHLEKAMPDRTTTDIQYQMTEAFRKSPDAIRLLADHGVSVAQLRD